MYFAARFTKPPTMQNKHYGKFIINLLEGFIFLTAGIFMIVYTIFAGVERDNWYLWAIGIALVLVIGLFFLGSAVIHKVKSDFIRKQRRLREEYHEFTTE